MSGESRRDVETRDPGHGADDRVIGRRHLVVAGPRRRDAQACEERMTPCRARTEPGLERRWNDERRELAGYEGRGRRARTLLDPPIAGEVRHREALRRTLRPEVETGLPFDRQRDTRQRRVWARLHDRSRVRPDRHRDACGRGEPGGPAAGRKQDALTGDDAIGGAHAGHAIALAHDLERVNALTDLHATELCRRRESRERLDGVAVPILRAEAATREVVGADARHETLDL